MKGAIQPAMSAQVESVVQLISRLESIDISDYHPGFIARTLADQARGSGTITTDAYLELLQRCPEARKAFIEALEIPYSVFFRDPVLFAWLLHAGIPKLLDTWPYQGTPNLRIWSAGCSSGQEVWSLAMILDAIRETRHGDLSGYIVGSDRSPRLLEQAKQGIYPIEQFDNVPAGLMRRYVVIHQSTGQIGPRCRGYVNFNQHDLLAASTHAPPAGIFRDFDLIVCMNVLIYYRPEIQREAMLRLSRCLAPNGMLITGDAERSIARCIPHLQSVNARIPAYMRGDGPK